MKIIGLTGGMGSGKTTVANIFKALGIPVFIADEEAKFLMNTSHEIRDKVLTLFKEQSYIADKLNRKYIASVVFNAPEKLQKLNEIIHPAVATHFQAWVLKQTAPYVIYEAAILFETGGYKKCDKVILVTAPKQVRIKRLQLRDDSSISEIEARFQHQWSDKQKRKLTNYEIINEELAHTKQQVRNLHEILLKPTKN
tara:strand:- start:79 stop:669 length:591 start_codon:yes stop_codon:yes gene_type:complete